MRPLLARWLPLRSALRSVVILSGGTLFAQALTVASMPILTRLYSPEDFSLLAVYVAIISIVTVVACLRYNIAIPIPEHDADGMALLAVALLAAFGVSMVCTLPVIFFPQATAHLIGQPRFQPYLWMVPVGVFIASVYESLQYWSTRKKQFLLVTKTRVTRSVGGLGTQLVLGAVHPSSFGLIFGHMIYGGMGIFGLLRGLLKNDCLLLGSLDRSKLRDQALRYRRFPIYSIPEALLNAAGNQLPLIIIAATIAGPEAGYLFLAMRVIGLPMDLIGSSVAQVFLTEAPTKLRENTLATFTRRIMWILFITGAPFLLAIGVISPLIFPLVFGQEWAHAGWMVAWMTPWFILQFVASPVSMVIIVLDKQELSAALQGAGLILRVGAVLIAATVSPEFTPEIFALSSMLYYAFYILVVISTLTGVKYAP